MKLEKETENLLATIKAHSTEKEEKACNVAYAALSSKSAGRLHKEEVLPGENRTTFARDRDRIVFSKAFFRLAGKTQVFMSPRNPLVSNRMTHTIHVAQLSRALARALDLNEDLAEAIALGHDLGHPPFGHKGEKILDELSQKFLGEKFEHNVHSLRFLDVLEKSGSGLNLSYEVRDGIARHCGETTKGNFSPGEKSGLSELAEHSDEEPSTLEGCVVKLCDRIAFVGKDIEDAASCGIIKEEDIPQKITSVLGTTNGEIIDTLVKDAISNFYKDREIFLSNKKKAPSRRELSIRLSEPVLKAMNSLIVEFNYPRIYESDMNSRYASQTENMIRGLFNYFVLELDNLRLPAKEQASLVDFYKTAVTSQASALKLSLGELDKSKELAQEVKLLARKTILKKNIDEFHGKRNSVIYFLTQMKEDYWLSTKNAQIAIDYITMMTDETAMAIFESLTIPRPVV